MKRHERAGVRIYTEAQKLAKKAYRAARREKMRAYNAQYAEKNRDRIKLQRAKFRAENRERVLAAKKRDYEANREIRLEAIRQYHAENAEHIIARKRERRSSDVAAMAYHNNAGAKRRAAEVKATPKWANGAAIVAVYEEARRLTMKTGVPYHVDHVIPLLSKSVCGLHVESNLRAIPAVVNMKKQNKLLTHEIV